MAQIRENANIVYPPHAEVFVENVMTFFVKQELLDLIFICNDNIQVSVHKVVFVSVSRFLSEIVNLNPQDVLYVSLPDVDHKTLRILVHFLYEGVTKVTFEEMMAIKQVMSLLCIQLQNAEIRAVNPFAETSSFSFNDVKFENIQTDGNILSKFSHQMQFTKSPVMKILSHKSKSLNVETKLSKIEYHSTVGSKTLECIPSISNVRTLTEREEKEVSAAANAEKVDEDIVDLDSDSSDIIDLNSDVDDNDESLFKPFSSIEQGASAISNTELQSADFIVNIPDVSVVKNESSEVMEANQDYSVMDIEEQKYNTMNNPNMLFHIQTNASKPGESLHKDRSVKESTRLTRTQKNLLQAAYRENRLPSDELRTKLARKLDLSKNTIALWFKNRREKDSRGPVEVPKLSKEHITILETTYKDEGVPTPENQVTISHDLGIPTSKVRDWFAYRHTRGSTRSSVLPELNRTTTGSTSPAQRTTRSSSSPSRHEMQVDYQNSSVYRFNSEQKLILETEFQKNKFPTKDYRAILAHQLGVPPRKIFVWFSNRRSADATGAGVKKIKFSEEQKKILDFHYKNKSYKSKDVIEKLSQDLRIPSYKLMRWFERMQLDDEAEFMKDRHQTSEKQYVNISDEKEDNYQSEDDLQDSEETNTSRTILKEKDLLKKTNNDSGFNKPIMSRRRGFRLSLGKKRALEIEYNKNKYPSSKKTSLIANKLEIRSDTVKFWFMSRWKKDGLESGRTFQFSKEQESILSAVYEKDKNPSEESRAKLAEELGLKTMRVDMWFNSKKFKDNPESLENSHTEKQESTSHLTKEQINALQDICNKHPNMEVRKKLAFDLGISSEVLESWLLNRKEHDEDAEFGPLTQWQKNFLEGVYEKNKNPDLETRKQLARQIGANSGKVRLWFAGRKKRVTNPEAGENSNRLTQEQKNVLEEAYKTNQNFDNNLVKQLAHQVGTMPYRIRWWYNNRKQRDDCEGNGSLTQEHKNMLEDFYKKNKFPDLETRHKLASEIGANYNRVRLWFYARKKRDDANADPIKDSEFSEDQKNTLEATYKSNHHVSQEDMKEIAEKFDVPRFKVVQWFENRKQQDVKGDLTEDSFEFTDEQKNILEAIYLDDEDLDEEARENLAEQFTVPSDKVHQWFSNRQKRDKEIRPDPNSVLGRTCQKNTDSPKSQLTEEQKAVLEEMFKKTKFPDSKTREELAHKLGLKKIRVHLWFVHRRNRKSTNYGINSEKRLIRKNQMESSLGKKFMNDNLEARNPKKRWMTRNQLEILRNSYRKDAFPSRATIAHLAKILGLPVSRIKLWFGSKRARDKFKMKQKEGKCEFEKDSDEFSNISLSHGDNTAEDSNWWMNNTGELDPVICIDSDSMDTSNIKTESEDLHITDEEQLYGLEFPANNLATNSENETAVSSVMIKEELSEDFSPSDFVVSEMYEEAGNNDAEET